MGMNGLPFEAGQEVECRSFIPGYRGAWFRCKIKEYGLRQARLSSSMEYIDFPDEKVKWTRVYQKIPGVNKKSKSLKVQLMLRPRFPPIYNRSTIPDANTRAEVVVIVNDDWKVGDLVDWWKDGCYWSGRITEILGNESLKFDLPPPPDGEGYSYEVSSKELRPSLDWSPENGWTVPTPMLELSETDKEPPHSHHLMMMTCHFRNWHLKMNAMHEINCEESECVHPCARVMKPGEVPSCTFHAVGDENRCLQAFATASHRSPSSHVSASSLQPPKGLEEMAKQPLGTIKTMEKPPPDVNVGSDMADSGIAKASCSDSVSSSHVKSEPKGMRRTAAGEDRVDSNGSLKKMKTDRNMVLNSTKSDTLEAAILDLEELVSRVKWMKGVLEIGMPWTSATRPTWKFL
ncbi:unnamed protein product [Malus baccata var. baccata]